jgi:hypothetical protein
MYILQKVNLVNLENTVEIKYIQKIDKNNKNIFKIENMTFFYKHAKAFAS